MRRILPHELALYEALPWTVFDPQGHWLLRQGHVLQQQWQLDRLLQRGACVREPRHASAPRPWPEPVRHRDAPVAARVMRWAHSMERLHADLLAGVMRDDLRRLVVGLAHCLRQACHDDAAAVLSALHTHRGHDYLVVHQLLGAALVELVAQQAGVDAAVRLTWLCAALTRDVGMIDIQMQLDTQTLPLTPEQSEVVYRHPFYGENLLELIGVTDPLWLQMVREHQERCDGSGYPLGLTQKMLSEGSKLLAVADTYAAMVTPRANRSARTPHEVVQLLQGERQAAYDPLWVRELAQLLTAQLPDGVVPAMAG